jgi:hypothetical protein
MVGGGRGTVRVVQVELGAQKGKGNIAVLRQYNIAMSYWQYCGHIGNIADMRCHIGDIADMTSHILAM